MNTQDFAYWLQGYTEICGERPSEVQWEMIKEHLALVFKKETKSLSDIQYCFKTPEVVQPNLNGDVIDYSKLNYGQREFKINNSGEPFIKGLPYITC